MTNVVLCGGSGTRLWPLSRKLMPKQFVKLFEKKSLFQETIERNRMICDRCMIVSNVEHYFLASDQLDEIGVSSCSYLLEPLGRNTAPAIALACMDLDPEELVLVTPSDHLIKDIESYRRAVGEAISLASKNYLVTFGVEPDSPETGYGYIEARENDVLRFHEKPDLETAKKYLAHNQESHAKRYYWNAGIFCFKAGVLLEELAKYAPKILERAREAFISAKKEPMIRIGSDEMEAIPSDSIDYAVMEKSDNVKVVRAAMGWSDLGSFDALAEEFGRDERGNLILAEKRVELVDMEDTVVVDTPDALLISKKGSTQKVKNVVERLRAEGSTLAEVHTTGYRPWGSYTVLDESDGYKIKRIEVKPGKRLSLQKHYHRNEHWVVLSGSATVTVGERTYIVNPNESTYIKAGEIHRLENRGKLPLVIIEVQVGEYTGEDDIVRIEDDYQRMDR